MADSAVAEHRGSQQCHAQHPQNHQQLFRLDPAMMKLPSRRPIIMPR